MGIEVGEPAPVLVHKGGSRKEAKEQGEEGQRKVCVSLRGGALINLVPRTGNGILIYGLGIGVARAAVPALASGVLEA